MKLIFVSSTFKDMQAERDALHDFIEPVIDGELAPYGEAVYFGDLRWGVNTTALDSEEGSRRVLEVCLDEIDDCKPYMIVLIGERYGWIPEAELIRSAAKMKGIEVDGDISVTQLEIEYGALLSPQSEGRVLFYFRELDKTGMMPAELADYTAESELHREKIEELKARITALYPDAVRHYRARWDKDNHTVTGIEGFLDTVRDDLTRLLLRDIKEDESLPWQQRAIMSAHRYYYEKSEYYHPVSRSALSLIDGTFASSELRMRFIKGGAGSGKTALLANTYRRNYEKSSEGMLPFVLGLDKYSTCEMDYFKILLYELERLSDMPHYETTYGVAEPDEEVFKRIFIYQQTVDCIVHSYIDNCSFELQSTLSRKVLDVHIKNVDFEYFNTRACSNENLDFFIAYSAGEPIVILPPWFDYSKTFILDEIQEDEVVPFVNTLLKSKHKELADEVVVAISQKDTARVPMYLKLVVDRLLMLDSDDFASIRGMGDGMDNINRYQLSVIASLPENVEGMAGELIRKVAERVPAPLLYRMLALLTYSSVRLTEGEIAQTFEAAGWDYSTLDFSLATRSLSALINYNPKDKSYSITNPDVLRATTDLLDSCGYTYVARSLFDYIITLPDGHRLYDALFRVASYVGEDFLVEFFAKQHEMVEALAEETKWLIVRRGAGFVAQILTRVALDYPEYDFSYIIERVPTACLTEEDYSPYCELLQTILDNLRPSSDTREQTNRNTLAAIAWCKLVSIRMLVNASDAVPLFHELEEEWYGEISVTDRARVQLEAMYFRFIAREAYYSMSSPDARYKSPQTVELINETSFPRDGETVLHLAHLYSAFALYCERTFSFDVDYKEYRQYALKCYQAILRLQLSRGDAATFSCDDVAMMIDTSLEDKGEYSSIDHARLASALEFMAYGQTYVDSRLNKYLPKILEAARFSYDDESEPILLYLRICAYGRAVAGGAMTLDDCVWAAIQMGYAADILINCGLGDEYFNLLTQLDRFIRISISFSGDDPRTLYRLYTPLRHLMTVLDIYEASDALENIAAFISSREFTDEDAPLLPELFVGSLIYCFIDKGNEEKRLALRAIHDTVTTEEEYSRYATSYSPELMYIGIDLRSAQEIADDDELFTYEGESDASETTDECDDDDGEDGFGAGIEGLEALFDDGTLEELGLSMEDIVAMMSDECDDVDDGE